jgi:radical SAM-linked protein
VTRRNQDNVAEFARIQLTAKGLAEFLRIQLRDNTKQTVFEGTPPTTAAAEEFEPMVRQRVRIRFCKQGDLRFIGHRDLVRLLERLFRRAGLRLGMSEGFHPKPRMSFPSALAVGIEGLDEVMELELAEACEAEPLGELLARHAVPGLEFHSVEILPPHTAKAALRSAAYEVPLPEECRDEAAAQIDKLLAAESCPIRRPRKDRTLDLRPLVEELALSGGVLRMRLKQSQQAGASVRDVLKALGLEHLEQAGVCPRRTAVRLQT